MITVAFPRYPVKKPYKAPMNGVERIGTSRRNRGVAILATPRSTEFAQYSGGGHT